MPALLNAREETRLARLTHGFYDDFAKYVSGRRFTSVISDLGSVAVADGVGGIVTLTPSDGTVADNDEVYIKSTRETFLFGSEKPLAFESLVQFSEAATNAANVIVGLKDNVAANTLQDNGAGPPASYSGAVFFKTDGSTLWQVETSIGGTQLTTTTQVTAGGPSYQRLGFEVITNFDGTIEVVFRIDGEYCLDSNNRIIKHRIAYSGATEMQACLGVKIGSANQQTLNADFIQCWQKRN